MTANDNRKLRRFIINVKVYDRNTDEPLGYTANMHTEGMMVNSYEQIEPQQVFAIRLEHISLDDEVFEIELDARCLWCRPGQNPDFYQSGFCFINPDVQSVDAVRNLIRLLEVKNG